MGESASESAGKYNDSGYRVPPAPIVLAVAKGWNLKGTPVTCDHSVKQILSPISRGSLETAAAFCWTGEGYQQRTGAATIPANTGFWVFSRFPAYTEEFSGRPRRNGRFEDVLASGWNLYSPRDYQMLPKNCRLAGAWRWDAHAAKYRRVASDEALMPREGYWIWWDPMGKREQAAGYLQLNDSQ